MEVADIQNQAKKVLRWARQLDGWPLACNITTKVLAMGLFEFGEDNIEVVSCSDPEGNAEYHHEWLRWDGRISIDLTIEQFSATVREQIGRLLVEDGVSYVFGESRWHNGLECCNIHRVDESWVRANSIHVAQANEVFGSLEKCLKIRLEVTFNKLTGCPDSPNSH